jgi:DNA-binding transcriptional LysR family regulator
MELRHLRYFITVAEELSFRRAAQRLHMSQPPLSVQIAALESEIGVRLFNRERGQVTLTEAGQSFLPRARRTVFLTDRAVQIARTQNGQMRVALGYTDAMTFAILPDVVRRFTEENPQTKIELYTESVLPIVDALLQGDVHVALICAPITDSGLHTQVCHREPFVVVLPTAHRLAQEPKVHLSDLCRDEFVWLPRHLAPVTHDLMTSMCLSVGFAPRITHEVYGYLGMVSLTAAGFGVSLVSESVRRWSPPGVVFRDLADVSIQSETVVAWRRDDDRPITQALVRTIVALASAQPRFVDGAIDHTVEQLPRRREGRLVVRDHCWKPPLSEGAGSASRSSPRPPCR